MLGSHVADVCVAVGAHTDRKRVRILFMPVQRACKFYRINNRDDHDHQVRISNEITQSRCAFLHSILIADLFAFDHIRYINIEQ